MAARLFRSHEHSFYVHINTADRRFLFLAFHIAKFYKVRF